MSGAGWFFALAVTVTAAGAVGARNLLHALACMLGCWLAGAGWWLHAGQPLIGGVLGALGVATGLLILFVTLCTGMRRLPLPPRRPLPRTWHTPLLLGLLLLAAVWISRAASLPGDDVAGSPLRPLPLLLPALAAALMAAWLASRSPHPEEP